MAADLKGLAGVNGSHNDTPCSTPGGSTMPADERPLLKSHSSASNASAESMEELDGKYAPFVRRDAYGTMGRGELSVAEKVVLGIAAVTLVPIRLVMGVTILVVYALICRICTLFSAPNREDEQEDYAHLSGWRRKVIVRCGRFLSRALLFTFGFYWIKETRITNDDNSIKQGKDSKRPGAVVSNHISYVDILYHMSSSFPSFVAKRSVSKLPLIGLISKCLGCVYVQRESKSFNFKGVSGVVTERIQEAHAKELFPMMLLFPEGTTTNGDYLLPFKSGAFLAKVPVLPVILRYPYSSFSPAWDSISGARHVFLLLCQFVNYIEVIQLPIYYPSEQEKADAKLYSNNVRKLMATEGNLTLSEIGLAEKRIYHAVLNGSVPTVVLLVPFMYVEYSETFTFSIKKQVYFPRAIWVINNIYNSKRMEIEQTYDIVFVCHLPPTC